MTTAVHAASESTPGQATPGQAADPPTTAHQAHTARPPAALWRRLLPGMSEGEAGWQASISRGARIVVGLSAGFGLLGAIGPALDGSGGTIIVSAGTALLVASLVALILDLALNHTARWAALVVVGLFAAGVVLTLPDTIPSTFDASHAWWPAGPTGATLLYGVLLTRGAARWVVLAVMFTLHLLTRLAYWPLLEGGPHWERIAILAVELGGLLMLVAGSMIALAVVTRVARQADAAVREEAAAIVEVAEQERRDRRSRAVDRFVHDEVLHVLRTIALDRGAISAHEARAGAVRLASLLDAESRPSTAARAGLAERLREVAAQGTLAVEITGDDILLPEHIEDAFAAAVGEALHNVTLHAGVAEAEVSIAVERETVAVRVSDTGRGFTPQDVDGRHGIADSIIGRLHDVGGEATVTSEPGAGTHVELTWAPRPEKVVSSGRTSFGVVRRFYPAVVTAILPFAVGLLWNEAWLAATLWNPAAGWIATVLTIGTFAVLAARALRHGLTWVDSVFAAVVAIAATWLNGIALPESGPTAQYMWISGGALILMALISQFRAPWESLLLAVGIEVGVILTSVRAFGWADTFRLNLTTISMPILGIGVALTVRWVLETMAHAIGRSEANVVRELESGIEHREFMEELGLRVGRRHEAVGAFIDAVADGREDVSDPGVRARAASLEGTIRESLFASPEGILDRALRTARAAGMALELRVSGTPPVAVEEACAQALVAVSGPGSPSAAQLNVMPDDGGWRLSLTADDLTRSEVRRLAALEEQGWTLRAHEGSARALRLIAGNAGKDHQ